MSLRIAYMTGEYPRVTDTFIQREVAALRRRGVEIETFSIRRPSSLEAGRPEEVARTVYVLPCPPARLISAHVGLLVASPRRYLAAARLAWSMRAPGLKALLWQLFYFGEAAVVATEMGRKRIGHLHNHFASSSCSVAMLAAALGSFTFSFTIHGPAEFLEASSWSLGEKAEHALFVVCISHFCRSQLMIWTPIETWNRFHIVHCGVEPGSHAIVDHRGTGSRLLWVGRLAKLKGLRTLLEATAKLKGRRPELKLEIVGDGPDRDSLEALARTLGLEDHIRFLGYLSPPEVEARMREAGVFVMSSLAEGVPVVLMEALASGLPVVAPAIGGIGELVEHGVSGFLTPASDVECLVERIEELLASPDLRLRMGKAGRARVEREFDAEIEAARLHQILLDALAENAAGADAVRPEDCECG